MYKRQLLVQAVKLFAEPFDKLLNAVDVKCKLSPGPVGKMTYTVTPDQAAAVQASLNDWSIAGKLRRLWARDASLWTGADEGQWLGWLSIVEDQIANRELFEQIAGDVKSAGFKHCLLYTSRQHARVGDSNQALVHRHSETKRHSIPLCGVQQISHNLRLRFLPPWSTGRRSRAECIH